MVLEPKVVKLVIVEGAELRRQPPKGPDKPELRCDDVDHETKPRLLRKLEAILSFTLHLGERVSRREKVGIQVVAAIAGIDEVTHFVRSIKGATYQITATPDMSRPGNDEVSETHIRAGLRRSTTRRRCLARG